MKATMFNGPGDVKVRDCPDPKLQDPGDAIVRVVFGCVCGSDLWYYRGESPHDLGPIGHEFIGIVEEAGDEVSAVRPGDLVIAPFRYSDGTCPQCRAGWYSSCEHGGAFGGGGADGGQGEYVRTPFADATLVPVPGSGYSDETLKSLTALSDVMGTGYHAAVSAGVEPGDTVAVVGDGAVGLCAIIGAKRLGAERIISVGTIEARREMASELGATDIVPERGDEAVARVRDLTGGLGVDAALECVGTGSSMSTAFGLARDGSLVGTVGFPHGVVWPADAAFMRNVGLRGGLAPVRRYIPELLGDVLASRINPGRVFTFETGLDGVEDAYQEMLEQRAIKSLLRIGSI
jgi:threonine dehydrogenase-like Zn-dependent dehydrogenase